MDQRCLWWLRGRLSLSGGFGYNILDADGLCEAMLEDKMENNKLFVYGILKRNYPLDLSEYGGQFIGEAHIEGATLFGIHPYYKGAMDPDASYAGVGLRLNTQADHVAHGELWEVPEGLWKWLDEIEQNGFAYTRKIVPVLVHDVPGDPGINGDGVDEVQAWVYEHSFPGFDYKYPLKGGRF
jgi:gamma-glutamylcyclotransferase (GGCT)/AIG2-like uncharacterized protein YtfP